MNWFHVQGEGGINKVQELFGRAGMVKLLLFAHS